MCGKDRIARIDTGEPRLIYKDPAHATEAIDD